MARTVILAWVIGAAVAFRAGSYSDARPLSEVRAAPSE